MSPTTIFEGVREPLDAQTARRLAERRFTELAAAVRTHEAQVRRREYRRRPYDETLYRTLRRVIGERPAVLEAVPPPEQQRSA
jgi:hypothetical protein